MVDKVIELLHEYQDLFPTKFMELKCTVSLFNVEWPEFWFENIKELK